MYSQTDSLASRSYKELRDLYQKNLQTNDSKTALIYISKAYQKAEKKRDTLQMIYASLGIGNCKSLQSQNTEALIAVENAIRLAKTINNTEALYESYNTKGIIFSDTGDYVKSLEAYIKSREFAVLMKNPLYEIQSEINIGFIKKLNKDYEVALTVFTNALDFLAAADIDSVTKNHFKRFLYTNLTDTYLRMREIDATVSIDKAAYYNELGLDISSKTKNAYDYYTLLLNKAIIHFQQKQYKESSKLAEELKIYAETTENEKLLSTSYFYLGKNAYYTENYAEAIENLNSFYKITQTSEIEYSNENQLHVLLSWSYFEIGAIEKSKFHHQKAKELLAITNKKNVEVITAIQDRSDLPEARKKIKTLEEAFQRQEKNKNWLYGISIFLFIGLIASILFYRKKVKRIRKRVEAALQKANALEQQQEKEAAKKSGASISEKVTDTKAALLLEKLAQFEADQEYLSLDCSLSFVAEKLESNTSYVSNVINNYKQKSFKAYITELRIDAALVRLKNDEKLRSYTIKAIAEEFGFKRQETFSKAFKSYTGIYPSQYLKKLRADLEID
jgi:AraC-like DNA-binding protein